MTTFTNSGVLGPSTQSGQGVAFFKRPINPKVTWILLTVGLVVFVVGVVCLVWALTRKAAGCPPPTTDCTKCPPPTPDCTKCPCFADNCTECNKACPAMDNVMYGVPYEINAGFGESMLFGPQPTTTSVAVSATAFTKVVFYGSDSKARTDIVVPGDLVTLREAGGQQRWMTLSNGAASLTADISHVMNDSVFIFTSTPDTPVNPSVTRDDPFTIHTGPHATIQGYLNIRSTNLVGVGTAQTPWFVNSS